VNTVNIHWPTTGDLLASDMTHVSGAIAGGHEGNAAVKKLANTKDAAQLIGIGDITVPPNNQGVSPLKLQIFDAPMNPDMVEAYVSGSKYAARLQPHDFTDGATLAVGVVNSTHVGGTDLGDATFAADGDTNWDSVKVYLLDWNTNVVAWAIYATGHTLASRSLPHLPSTVSFNDLAGAISPRLAVGLARHKTGAPPSWQATGSDLEVVASRYPVSLDPSGR
jgi:hypothetical protein